ncbi:TolC family protein [Chitinophagaceae bacterium LB-8]|uniref:TolC family protein n=1 Tax=Paraflavisolibacter caeni TaxID=2982496 RepID=A0A9X3B9R2_9BACT|nr:TolC family protein [Paraflavisolibacter caeni]MCU7552350.1 TolC family protein [Paraflavisolibacter caeni]
MRVLTKWFNKAVKNLLFFLATFVSLNASTQSLTLESAYQRAREQYPLTKQKGLIKQTADLTIQNLSRGYWPQIVVYGQATYQSSVTAVNINNPAIKIEVPSKDQYKLFTDVSQVLYDGGEIKQQKTLQQLNATVEEGQIEVELYQLRQRITQLYLGVMLLEEQMKQVELVKKDLQGGERTVEAQVANGLVLRSNLNVLKAEVLSTDQRLIELKAARKGLIDVLGLFLNQDLPETTVFILPGNPAVSGSEIKRPELNLYNGQSNLFQQQKKLVDARNRPRTSAFVQGGYGRPVLNLFKNEFEPYFIVGLRMNWSLSDLYTAKREKKLYDVNQKSVDVQKEVFLLNTNMQLKQQAAEIMKWSQLIATDKEIIALRESVKEAAKAQLENRVITANDYLKEVNEEDSARQNLILHEMQLLQAQINYQIILGDQ